MIMQTLNLNDILKELSDSKIPKGSTLRKIAQVKPETEAFVEQNVEDTIPIKDIQVEEVELAEDIQVGPKVQKKAEIEIGDETNEGEDLDNLDNIFRKFKNPNLSGEELRSVIYPLVLDPEYAFELLSNYSVVLSNYAEMMQYAIDTVAKSADKSQILNLIQNRKIYADDLYYFVRNHPELTAQLLQMKV